ncbi:hypothetical protein V6N13_053555 [Hibiscus sabdariffa]
MASFSVFFVLSLHALILISSTATCSLHPLALPHQAVEDEVKISFCYVCNHENNESKEFSNGKNKSALIQEGREANKASMKSNTGNPLGLKRLSPRGPVPHHHR